ncbi:MBL fold metallo-hydrolase [Boudabousia marimammalium]|uniref:Metallo-beta-lactamase domain-containing protein n=1 Tax=Boudabousia marimammalium TaxID=156892 RepID=A0A1Q5PLZ1_9ACTO|nr:MBL fold metallo-hydrolase [Boudabousia marimammalium]OKL48072.1 hypothetical protein BM477_06295 [Boudabousia marimammalium]
MKLTIVGCTGSMSGPKSAASSYLLQAPGPDGNGGTRIWSILLDLGPGGYGQMWNYLKPTELDAVALTHLHADHCADLVSLHVFQKWAPCSSGGTISLIGPKGTTERIGQIDGNTQGSYDHEFDVTVISAHNREVEIGPFKITAFPAWHPVRAWSYRIEGPAGFPTDEIGNAKQLGPVTQTQTAVFTYTGDTDLHDPTIAAANGANLLLAEAGFTATEVPTNPDGSETRGIHMTAERTGQLAKSAGVGALVATHIQPWTEAEVVEQEINSTWDGPFEIAESGKSYLI